MKQQFVDFQTGVYYFCFGEAVGGGGGREGGCSFCLVYWASVQLSLQSPVTDCDHDPTCPDLVSDIVKTSHISDPTTNN